MKPRVWYLPPESHTEKVFRPEVFAGLRERCDLTATEGEHRVTQQEVTERAGEFDAIITGWGSPAFTPEALADASRLRLIAHSAGSVKFLFPGRIVPEILVPRGVTVACANRALAYNVAEATVGYLIAIPRQWYEHIDAIRHEGVWLHPDLPKSAQFLSGATVGLVSASTVAREVIRLLKPFPVRILVHDPLLSEQGARELGVERRQLDDLFAEADFISLHAPSIPATRHMIGQRQLALMRPGALLINTARGSILDHDALLEEARRGRIRVVLDVTDPEPPAPNHPLRSLPNVYFTPHVSGAGAYGYLMIGDMTVAAVDAFFAGRPVEGEVDLGRWEELA